MVVLIVWLFLFGKPGFSQSPFQDAKDKVPSMQEAEAAIQKALKLKANSYQVLLRDVIRTCLDG
jgi:hypothetical protein